MVSETVPPPSTPAKGYRNFEWPARFVVYLAQIEGRGGGHPGERNTVCHPDNSKRIIGHCYCRARYSSPWGCRVPGPHLRSVTSIGNKIRNVEFHCFDGYCVGYSPLFSTSAGVLTRGSSFLRNLNSVLGPAFGQFFPMQKGVLCWKM